ncbi:substrate-binding domain-containing protein [Adlercreutzia sp.]|uniref:substrate-binding domain-containing protein n=1 Tax=Adlercreutzia sp. TaxID=1872387 RepID=UPI003A8A4413
MKASSVSSRLPRRLRRLAALVGAAALCGALVLAGCAGTSAGDMTAAGDAASAAGDSGASASGPISVYSREDGSGTRGAFVELLGIEQADANGDKVDMTTSTAAITNSTAVMMTSVAGDPNAIGYISLGSLDDTVKAVSIDGVAPSAAAVKDGSYAIARPFNVVTKGDLSAPAADFFAFIMSADGQAVVSDNNYIAIDDAAAPFASNGASGKVVVAGSSSVTPVMEKLAEAFQAANPQVTVEVQQSDSTTGVNMAVDGTCDIGMASRDLKDSETGAGAEDTAIALDGIAVIVAPQSSVDNLTSQQVCDIYTGAVTNWADVA